MKGNCIRIFLAVGLMSLFLLFMHFTNASKPQISEGLIREAIIKAESEFGYSDCHKSNDTIPEWAYSRLYFIDCNDTGTVCFMLECKKGNETHKIAVGYSRDYSLIANTRINTWSFADLNETEDTEIEEEKILNKTDKHENEYLKQFLTKAFSCQKVEIIYASDPNITNFEIPEDEAKVVLRHFKENLNITLGEIIRCIKNDTMGLCVKWEEVYQVLFRCYRDNLTRRYYYVEYYPNFTIKRWLELKKK